MIKDECKQHIWKRIGSASRKEDVGTLETPFHCENCPAEMTASEVFQLEALENQTNAIKDQTRATSALVITTIVAFTTLILVTIGFYFDYIK